MVRNSLTQERIRELLDYNQETGIFTRKISLLAAGREGDVAGTVMGTGYIEISIQNRKWLAHRAACLYMVGYVPKYVDHINRVKSDNSWDNLRECSHSENMKNTLVRKTSRTGCKNVGIHKNGLYCVMLKINGKRTSFGYFKDLELADLVAQEARSKYYL